MSMRSMALKARAFGTDPARCAPCFLGVKCTHGIALPYVLFVLMFKVGEREG